MPSILLWILWFGVTVFGLTGGMEIGISLMTDYWLRPLYILMGFGISGLIIGFGQWLLLRSRISHMWRWIPATAIGLPLGILFGFFGGTLFMSITAGLFTSTFQWVAIRKKLNGSFRWIMVSTISWGTGMTVALYLFETYLRNADFLFGNYSKIGLLTGVIVGAISGCFVESMLINPGYDYD